MKKIILLLSCFVFFCSTCYAEETDLTTMSFDELCALKVAVEAELNARPEAEPFDLSPGLYTVGEDVKAGRYYIMASAPHDYTPIIHVYPTKNAYEENRKFSYSDALKFGAEYRVIDLEDGNYLHIEWASIKFSVTEFTEDDYYKYTPPEGTYVPAGVYIVGDDIPAGIYQVYPATLVDGIMLVHDVEADDDVIDHARIKFTVKGTYETVQLRDGNKVEVDTDAIMKKQPKLNFD